MVSVVNGASVGCCFYCLMLHFCSDPRVTFVRLFRMINDVIMCYTLILHLYFKISLRRTSCSYCGAHVGAPGLILYPGVTEWLTLRRPILLGYTHVGVFIIRRFSIIIDRVDIRTISSRSIIALGLEYFCIFTGQSFLQQLANISEIMIG